MWEVDTETTPAAAEEAMINPQAATEDRTTTPQAARAVALEVTTINPREARAVALEEATINPRVDMEGQTITQEAVRVVDKEEAMISQADMAGQTITHLEARVEVSEEDSRVGNLADLVAGSLLLSRRACKLQKVSLRRRDGKADAAFCSGFLISSGRLPGF